MNTSSFFFFLSCFDSILILHNHCIDICQVLLWVLSFGHAKGEEAPLSWQGERCCLSFIESLFEVHISVRGLIQASHDPLLQWPSKCCETWRCLLQASAWWASALTLVHHAGTMGQWSRWVIEGNASGQYYFMSDSQNNNWPNVADDWGLPPIKVCLEPSKAITSEAVLVHSAVLYCTSGDIGRRGRGPQRLWLSTNTD